MNLTDIAFHNENPLHSHDLKNWRRDSKRSLADRKQSATPSTEISWRCMTPKPCGSFTCSSQSRLSAYIACMPRQKVREQVLSELRLAFISENDQGRMCIASVKTEVRDNDLSVIVSDKK